MTHKSPPTATPVQRMAVMMIIALLIQFLLGMYTNLFIALPRVAVQESGGLMLGMGRMMAVGFSDPVFMVHMIVGMLLVLGALATVMVGISVKQTPFMVITVIGLAAVLIAGYGGLTFFMNGQHNSASYTMAVGWLSAVTIYFMAYVRASAG